MVLLKVLPYSSTLLQQILAKDQAVLSLAFFQGRLAWRQDYESLRSSSMIVISVSFKMSSICVSEIELVRPSVNSSSSSSMPSRISGMVTQDRGVVLSSSTCMSIGS